LKIALLVAVLGFSVWSASAWALPFNGGAVRVEVEREQSTPGKHRHRSLRPQADDAGQPPTHATAGRWWTTERRASILDRRVPARAVPAVPEPSALMLFGVGLLVALRAPAHLRRASQRE